MFIEKLALSHFRNYTREKVHFSPGVNCIQGDNAEGKSNLLEALYLLSTGKSFRSSRLQDLIQQGASRFEIEITFVKEEIPHVLKASYGPDGRKILYNHTAYASFLPLLGILPCVLLAPEDVSILTGSPAERRRFLDLHLSQIDPSYVHHLGRYHKAMKQKNTLLKQKQEKGIPPWEEIMAVSASYLVEKRIAMLHKLEKKIQDVILLLSEEQELFTWQYQMHSSSTSASTFLQSWHSLRHKELLLGNTLVGPHRDDIALFIQGQEIKTYCSEGQKRSCIAALKMAEWHHFKECFGYPPLLGIDDFGVHLDERRTNALRKSMGSLGQVFLTAPSFLQKQPHINPSSFFEVRQGSIRTGSPLHV
jgi:DNA replication and repair protein RecF